MAKRDPITEEGPLADLCERPFLCDVIPGADCYIALAAPLASMPRCLHQHAEARERVTACTSHPCRAYLSVTVSVRKVAVSVVTRTS